MSDIGLIQSFLQQASAQRSRSTALNPLAWILSITFAGMIGAGLAHLPSWVLILVGVFMAIEVLAYVTAYFVLLFREPDALRSERFQLSKMAIERSVIGDNLAGFVEPEALPLANPAAEPKGTKE